MNGTALIRKSIEIDVERAVRNRYEYVPFEVPSGIELVRVSYAVEGDAKIDIGLFESASKSSPPSIASFRGWSGSERHVILAGESVSTPGYFCAPIKKGLWSVALGFPRIARPSVVTVEVELLAREKIAPEWKTPVLRKERPGLIEELEKAREDVRAIPGVPIFRSLPGHSFGLLCGDFHTHSWHSGDAETPVVEMVAAAEARHMDFLAITDHNTVAHWSEIDAIQPHTGVTLIKGQEVTTYYGHFNAFLTDGIVDFRIENERGLIRSLKQARTESSLFSINHPKRIGPSWRLPYEDSFSSMEAWQAPWLWFNNESFRRWDQMLRSGRYIAGIGGSDVHDLRAIPAHQYGCPATWVYVVGEKSPLTIVEAVKRCAVCVSATPDSAIVVVEKSAEKSGDGSSWIPAMGAHVKAEDPVRVRVAGSSGREIVRVVGENSRVEEWIVTERDFEKTVEEPGRFGAWLRAELWSGGLYRGGPFSAAASNLVSMTNPVFVSA